MAYNIGLIVQLLLDEQSKNKSIKGVEEFSKSVEKAGDAITNSFDVSKYSKDDLWKEQAKWMGVTVEEAKEANRLAGIANEQRAKAVELVQKQRNVENQAKRVNKITGGDEGQVARENEAILRAKKAIIADEEAGKAKSMEIEKQKLDFYKKVQADIWQADVEAAKKKEDAEKIADAADKSRAKERAQRQSDAAALEKRYAQESIAIEKDRSKQLKEVGIIRRQAESLGRVGSMLAVGGGAVVAGMTALASSEVNRQKEVGQITAETQRWLDAQQRVEQSTQRISQVFIAAVLPSLERASVLAEKAAKFLEENPDVAKAIFSAASVAVTIGTLLTGISKGLRVYADIKYEAAQLIHAKAMDRLSSAMLADSAKSIAKGSVVGGLGSEAQKVLGPATGTASGVAGASGALVAGVTIAAPVVGAIIAKWAGNAIQKAFGQQESSWGDMLKTTKEGLVLWGQLMPAALEKTGLISTETRAKIFELQKNILGLGDASEEASKSKADETEAMKIMTDLERKNIDEEKKYADDRSAILDDAAKALSESNRALDKDLSNIASNLTKNIAKINEKQKESLSKLAGDLADNNEKAEKENQKRRAEIVAQGDEDIVKIRQQGQKALEQLEIDHSKNVADLTEARDAYGLWKEQNSYNEKKKELEDGTQEEIQQSRRNTQQKLQEEAASYAEERALRFEEYNKRKQEILDEASKSIADEKAQAEEDKKKAIAQQKEEAEKIAAQQKEKLAALEKNFNEERNARAVAAYNQIKDLGTALNAERTMRLQYQQAILADTTAHMEALKRVQSYTSTSTTSGVNIKAVATVTNPPKYATGGYTPAGIIESHDGEFVTTKKTTKALENMIGGRLNQENILNAGRRVNITWNDYRHYEADVSETTREELKRDTMEILDNAISKANSDNG